MSNLTVPLKGAAHAVTLWFIIHILVPIRFSK